uniref:protein O-GlcNAc transferase n=1 Tax=uncultured marine bacterium 560 TaxID=257395 RepID=Q6SGF8_9BACT|nr:TPR domain protein [uncultured marine bacterium 560]
MTTASPPQTEINSVITLYSSGQIQEALDTVETLTKDFPNEPLLYNISGVCYKTIGQLDVAVKSFEKALAIKPDYTEVNYNLGLTFQELGQLDAAVKCYEDVLAVNPEHAEAHNNLGVTLKELEQLDAAVKSYEKAIAIKPDYAEAHNNLGNALKELGQLDVAVKSYEKAIAIKPDFAETHNNLGNALQGLGQLDEAVKCYEQAIAIKPDYAEAHNNLGISLRELGQVDAAVKSYEKALAIKPDFAEAYYNRGNVLKGLKRLDEALVSLNRAIVLKPDIDFILGDLLHTKMDLCIWDDLSNHINEITKKINNSEKVIHPFPMLALIDEPEVQRKTAEIFANEKYSQSHLLSKIERYPKHKKIRIGYFSADFRDHPVSHLTAELYEIHDRNQFEIYAFSFGPDTQDEMNLRIKAGVDHFHDVRSMSHKEVVMLARSLEIDIAVDLTGFTQNARTEIFAMSVAPIQISYIGYIGTMGANYYDYLVADQTMIPKKNQKYFSEKIAYLPSYQANDSTQSPPEIFFTRQDLGLPETGFVFCCFNNTFKITPTTFDSWGRILEHVEGSVLLIYANNESAKLNLTKEIVLRGIDPSRLIFGEKLPMSEYLARYRVVDLFLDTHPYNAGTIASGALRMGLPVLTCIGNSFASRMGASVINAVNLPELITSTQKEYESLAIELATHPEQLKIIKDKLASNLPTAPLYDTPLFTRHLESAYLTMYDRYQQGLEPGHIYVENYM